MHLTETETETLESLGFIGVDVCLEISLFEYHFLYSEKLEIMIANISRTQAETDKVHWQYLPKQEIIDELTDIDNGFYDYIGTSEADYKDKLNFMHAVGDLISYHGSFIPTACNQTVWEALNEVRYRVHNKVK